MSSHTRTLELPALDHVLDREEPPHAHTDAHEPEPTTAAIPVAGGTEAFVMDEPEPGLRSTASLTLSPRRAKIALTVLAAGAFATGANEASIVALSPAIASGLGVSVAQVGILATAFALTVVVAAVPLTLLSSRFSPRATLTATLAVWTVGVGIAASAGSFGQLAGGRVVSAAAHALFWALVAPTAANLFAPHLRAMTVTRIMVGGAAAGVIGTPLITVAGEQIGWQAPYWGFTAIGVLLAVALALTLPSPPRGEDLEDEDAPVQHTRGDVPSLPHFIRVLTATFTAQVAMTATWTYIASFYADVAGMPTPSIPVLFALGGIVGVAATLAIGPFLARRAVQSVGLGILGIAGAWVLLATGTSWGAVAGQIFQAAGWAVLVAALLNWAMRHTPWRTDVGASTYMMTANSGAAVGPLLGGAALATLGLAFLPLVSLALTIVAGIIVGTVDPKVRRRLAVSRQVRVALQRREDLRSRREEWRRRTRPDGPRPIAAAWSVGQAAARHAGTGARSLTRGAVAASRSTARGVETGARSVGRGAKAVSRGTSDGMARATRYAADTARAAADMHVAQLQALDPYREDG
ncbi:MFS transporter [Demequina zhanjiangensis]|uniref:MFS transporter n=1 Tax=Demequina zhanjiangensis TaxID=3051659 RepID=A0ABT8G337_9MICO|nr:MFS transporter [Demequina sp. SYSU T00b26]MDN4473508.1 MFS transporter [Demequina sp. SYSU T00b26]